jgi:hypothetical protein
MGEALPSSLKKLSMKRPTQDLGIPDHQILDDLTLIFPPDRSVIGNKLLNSCLRNPAIENFTRDKLSTR